MELDGGEWEAGTPWGPQTDRAQGVAGRARRFADLLGPSPAKAAAVLIAVVLTGGTVAVVGQRDDAPADPLDPGFSLVAETSTTTTPVPSGANLLAAPDVERVREVLAIGEDGSATMLETSSTVTDGPTASSGATTSPGVTTSSGAMADRNAATSTTVAGQATSSTGGPTSSGPTTSIRGATTRATAPTTSRTGATNGSTTSGGTASGGTQRTTTTRSTTTTSRPATTAAPTTKAPTTAAPPPAGNSCASGGQFELVMRDDFNGSSVGGQWAQFNSTGNAGNGLRRPSANTVANGQLRITAQMVNGTLVSGGMEHSFAQTYGKYVVRVRTDVDPARAMSGVVLTWPNSNVHPRDGENNLYETLPHQDSPTRNPFYSFIHKPFGSTSDQEYKIHYADAAQWQTMTMEWTPTRITITRNGSDTWTVNETSADLIPDVAHRLHIQLDATKGSVSGPVAMDVDYVEVHRYCG